MAPGPVRSGKVMLELFISALMTSAGKLVGAGRGRAVVSALRWASVTDDVQEHERLMHSDECEAFEI